MGELSQFEQGALAAAWNLVPNEAPSRHVRHASAVTSAVALRNEFLAQGNAPQAGAQEAK